MFSDEFKGHSLLEGARQTDLGRVKKYLDVVSFKHPYTGDTALVRRERYNMVIGLVKQKFSIKLQLFSNPLV